MKCHYLIISGKVQGVGYRAWAQREAVKLGLKGRIKNKMDGTVECLVYGAKDDLDAFIGMCYQGPPLSQVSDIQVTTIDTLETFETMEIRH